MKTVTLLNWAIVGIYVLILLLVFTSSNSQQDAAGRGMAAGLLFVACLFLGLLVTLNLLPYSFGRITALVLGGCPLVLYGFSLVIGPLRAEWREKTYENERRSRTDGSYYFEDTTRRQLAAAIARSDVNQLQIGLQQAIPNLNESGKEHTTLLDFATSQAKEHPSPKSMLCLELLLAKGATIENADTLHSPAHFLVTDGDPALLAWFLKKGANPNAKDSPHGRPLLFNLLYLGNSDQYKAAKIALLLSHGADPNASPPYEERVIDTSPLIYAAENELWDICQLLLDKGADPAHKTRDDLAVQTVMSYKEKSYIDSGKTPPTELITLQGRINALLAKAY